MLTHPCSRLSYLYTCVSLRELHKRGLPRKRWGLLHQTRAAAGMDSPSRTQTERGQRVWLTQSPASGPGCPHSVWGVAGVVSSGSAPSLWEPGNKEPYSALAASAPLRQGRLPSGKGTVGRWALLTARLSLGRGPQQGWMICRGGAAKGTGPPGLEETQQKGPARGGGSEAGRGSPGSGRDAERPSSPSML